MTDDQIREHIYRHTVEHGRPPRSKELESALSMPPDAVRGALGRLRDRRLLALAPGSGEIIMAPPFSAIPTPFLVRVGDRTYFANCVWDAYGVAAALDSDADVDAACACCGEPMTMAVRDRRPAPTPGVAHFAIPASRWWDDIVFT